MKKLLVLSLVSTVSWAAAEKPAKVTMAKICGTCHESQESSLRGYFENVSLKLGKIQLRMDETVELLDFNSTQFKITNGANRESLEYLQEIPKNKEVKVEYIEKDGKRYATALSIKQPFILPKEMLISTEELAKLVALGSEKGKYFLYDSRPPLRTQEGMIPTAVNLPFPAFDQNVGKLPKDKDALVIFYCAGVTCAMSPSSAKKAQNLGYKNIRVYHEGMPEWSKKHYTLLTAKSFKEGWLDKGMPSVLIDIRKTEEAEKGHLKGALTVVDVKQAIALLPPKNKKAPIIVYGNDTEQVVKFAEEILSAGYGNVKVLQSGMGAWNEAHYPVELGKLETKIVYIPKLKPGEIAFEDFKKTVESGLKDVWLIDVRPMSESARASIKDAKHIPVAELEKHFGEISKDQMVLLYCNTGTLAEMAYYTLLERGYTNVKFLNKTLDIRTDGTYSVLPGK
ncbi:Sulfurtransferase [Gammaproteobacteria bacterium]